MLCSYRRLAKLRVNERKAILHQIYKSFRHAIGLCPPVHTLINYKVQRLFPTQPPTPVSPGPLSAFLLVCVYTVCVCMCVVCQRYGCGTPFVLLGFLITAPWLSINSFAFVSASVTDCVLGSLELCLSLARLTPLSVFLLCLTPLLHPRLVSGKDAAFSL